MERHSIAASRLLWRDLGVIAMSVPDDNAAADTELGPDRSEQVAAVHAGATAPPRASAWIFQSNPATFDLVGYLAATKDIRWLVRQGVSKVRVGDTVYLWQTMGEHKATSGVLAVATVTEAPIEREDDPVSVAFWKERSEASKVEMRAGLRVLEVASAKRVIQREWLKEDPICADLPNLRMPQGTNYTLNPIHAARLARLWTRTGRTFDRYELLVCLAAYAEVYGTPISKLPGSAVSRASASIGRAVSSVYSKLMNFRSLDPRHEGDGQTNIGEGDRRIWNEFWSDGTIDIARLTHELETLATPGSTKDGTLVLEAEASDPAVNYSAEGQRRLVFHLRTERNRRVVDDAKAHWFNENPHMPCCVCGISFVEMYGSLGDRFIEAHHREPLSSITAARVPSVADLDPVCANCHRMLHRDDALTPDLLRQRLNAIRMRKA